MQSAPMITFHCPSCGMKLQVPQQMAGVTGPCPQCSASIIAPQSTPAPASAVTPAPVQAQQQPIPQPQQPVTQPQQPPVEPAQPQQQQQQATAPVSQPIAPLNRPTTNVEEPMVSKGRRRDVPRRRPRWMKVVFPLAFLMVAAVLVLVVLEAIGIVDLWPKKQTPSSMPDVGKSAPAAAPDTLVKPPAPVSSDTNPRVEPKPAITPPATAPDTAPETPDVPTSKPPEGEFPDLSPPPPGDLTSAPKTGLPKPTSEATPQSPDAKSPPQAGSLVKQPRFASNEVLEKFLAAKTLEDRLPLMTKSQRTKEELMASCLAGELRPVKSNYFSEMVPRMEDDMRQYLYYISFEDKEADRQRQMIVVQLEERPGIHEPRVHGDAFIEHYDKLLEKYAKQPSKKIHTFHCIAEARTADLVKSLPEELKKQMIRLVIKTHPREKVAFDAFLNKNSPLMEKIGPRAEFPYVKPRFCVLSFRWNTTDEKHPYIELVDIVTMGWER